MVSRTAQLIQYLVERAPGCGRTRLVKFLYLADHEARRYLGRPLTDLVYRFDNHGPFDPEILRQIEWICQNGNIQETVHRGDGYRWYEYKPAASKLPNGFNREERAILDHIVTKYANVALGALLEDIVYQTRPMLEATHRGEVLKLNLVDNEMRMPGMELESVLEAVNELESGGGVPLESLID